jgi:hypothetical protein
MTLPEQAAADYLRAIGAAAVYVLEGPAGVLCGSTQDLARSVSAWKQELFEPVWVNWVWTEKSAQWLADTADKYRDRQGRIVGVSGDAVVDLIKDVADRRDLRHDSEPLYKLSDHEGTIARATEMARRARINMDKLKQAGALTPFNKAYKRYNEGCKARGQQAIDYSIFEAELFRTVCRIVATGAEPLSADVLADMRSKFPFLSVIKS